ncbi:ankyrin [Coniochaeta sp. PMI_546]|nr:ankyrin [Coniochaeta sp. PMI_546]
MSQPASPPGLSGLPVEIMEFVVEHMLENDHEGSLAALAATCRGFHAIVMPRLYSKENMDKHPALIFWAAQLGRFDTAKRLVAAGVNLNRGMIRNESMAFVTIRTADFTPRQLYQDMRIMNHQINQHDPFNRVGPRGFVGEPFKPRPIGAAFDMVGFAHWRSWWFPLHLAVMGGFADLVDLFITSGAILDVPSGNLCSCKYPVMAANHGPAMHYRRPWTPLHTAICNGHIDIAKTLLERGASLSFGEHSTRIPHPFTVLHNAACVGSIELVEFILDNKYQTDVQVVDTTEMSPLWLAYLQRHWNVVDTLLARGADINDDLASGYTPLTDACLFGEFSSALELISRGADVNVVCTAYPTPLGRYRWPVKNNLLACLRGHRPIDLCCLKQQSATRTLRYRRDPPNPRYHPHEPPMPATPPEPFPVVDESLRTPVIKALLEAGAHIGPCEQSPFLVPPLVAAAAEHLVDVVRLLLDRGAEVDSRDKEGNTPLMAALNYSLHWCNSHAKIGPLSTRPFGLQRPPRTVPAVLPMALPPGQIPGGPPPPNFANGPPPLANGPPPPLANGPPNFVNVPANFANGPPPPLANGPPLAGNPPPQIVHVGNAPPQFFAGPPHLLNAPHPPGAGLPVIVVASPPKPPSCRQKGDFIACVKLLIERGASPTATNESGASPLSLVYSPDAAPDKRYGSGRPRGQITFKERAVIVSMLLDLGADPNTTVNIVRPDDSNSDIESDDPNVYSASESDDSLNTAPGSDGASSTASLRAPHRRKFRSLYKYGPLSVLQCAFWDGDLDICRSLLKRGAKLTTPVVAWMLHVAWGYCRWRMRDAAERVLQVLGDLDVRVQTELGSHPACLYVLITQGVRHMAADFLEVGIERSKFDDVPGPEYDWLFGDSACLSIKWGDLCLTQAARTGWLTGVELLLKLGLDVNTPGLEPMKRPLHLAIARRDAAMVECLVRHGASLNLSDDSEKVRFMRGERRYPLAIAIRGEESDIIEPLLRNQKEPLPEKFAFAYLKEAYMTRRAKALSCLLTFPCLDPHCKSPERGNTHLIEILKNVSAICDHQQASDDDTDDEDNVWSYSIKNKLEKVRMWIECLILLARAGISPAITNNAGVSGIDLFQELVNYKGPDRFKVHVRSALRSRLSDVMGVTVWDDALSADAAFEALARCEVNLAESDGSASSDGTIED